MGKEEIKEKKTEITRIEDLIKQKRMVVDDLAKNCKMFEAEGCYQRPMSATHCPSPSILDSITRSRSTHRQLPRTPGLSSRTARTSQDHGETVSVGGRFSGGTPDRVGGSWNYRIGAERGNFSRGSEILAPKNGSLDRDVFSVPRRSRGKVTGHSIDRKI